LIHAIEDKYRQDFVIKVCALQNTDTGYDYSDQVKYTLKTWIKDDYSRLAEKIYLDENIKVVYLQHEFGLYGGELGRYLLTLLSRLKIPVITTFHTVLSNPSDERKKLIQNIAKYSSCVTIMTNLSAQILKSDYQIPEHKVKVIPHGTHLIKPHKTKKIQYTPFPEKTILATFGLLSEVKSIETALDALPRIVRQFKGVLYLVIGKTHPEVLKNEGEKYRNRLVEKVHRLKLQKHVLFINKYLSLPVLLKYLQRADIYLFTSKDPQQAVSGTLAYAMSAGCPVIATPIPHSLELLDGAGINFDFLNSEQLAEAAITMLSDPAMTNEMRLNAFHKICPTAWQNAAIAHIELAKEEMKREEFLIEYRYPPISLDHIKRLTTDFGMIQFSKIAAPSQSSGYTLDDNARALIAMTKNFERTGDFDDLHLIKIYLEFILYCQQEDGSFLNYVTINQKFFAKNRDENLEDANGRAIWALGEFLSLHHVISSHLQAQVESAFRKALPLINELQSPRAIAFCIKGLYYYFQVKKEPGILRIVTVLADNLISKYRGVSSENWKWYEPYLTYANALLPEALLLAGKCVNSDLYKETAKKTFDFLLKTTLVEGHFAVISNAGPHFQGEEKKPFGEQPIEIAYTVLALDTFYEEFRNDRYLALLHTAFSWFLGENHLHQIVYNPRTGGCYDGLEESHVNLNQGAESTVGYLLARLAVENHT
jgi:glycosyltransferase involved in cell wall biosynthesis